jgi:hypothetical protein
MMRVWMAPRGGRGPPKKPQQPASSNRSDPAVHHVARRHDVHAGLGLHQRLATQHVHRLVVEDVAGVVEQAVLAVAGEGIERHVGEQRQLGEALLQLAHRGGHQALGVERLAAVGRLAGAVDHREQRHHRHAQLQALLGHREQAIDAAALHAGHAGHVLHLTLARQHEDGVDQVFGGQARLAHERADGGVAAQPARAARRVRGQRGARAHWLLLGSPRVSAWHYQI